MKALSPVTFRASPPSEDAAIAQHFYAMWRDLGFGDSNLMKLDLTVDLTRENH